MPTSQRDYYDILGVSRSATPDEIKKAYRKLARQYHPDLHTGSRKGEMEKKFKELNEAHEVVGDPDNRKKYDRYGHRWQEAEAYEKARQQAGAGQGFGGRRQAGPEFTTEEGFDFSDVFENLFGGRSRGGSGFRGGAAPGQDLETEARLTLREVLTGVTRRVEVTEPGGPNGRTAARTIDIKIPAGVQDGTRVRVAGKGGSGRGGGKQGDLYLRVHIEPDAVFRREGADLHVTLPVWPWEAALGADILAPTLAEPVRVKVPPGSRADSKLRLKGKGLPTSSGGRGDLFYTLQIVMPASLSNEDRKLYEQLGRAPHADPRAELLRAARG
ncbi:MAG TPA: J domain-containing protein [Nitrospiraceae bacterium]|nr:J domain-containing protein [Nitrospiraceae bacterium]